MAAGKQVQQRSCSYKQVLDHDHDDQKEEDVRLPGFRFHPTDEELVGFYLHRKVNKKLLKIDLIKQIDIYKYDPWDLPQGSDAGDNEWYYFCKRGRKYKNSIRPNRVTGSGFWKATGIDRPVYSSGGSAVCIGLKKSLVYYRGSAGKGTKTEWMMHEFRLPPSSDTYINTKKINMDDKSISQEAEVWTLCRILKRSVCHRKTVPDWKEVSTKRNHVVDASSKTCSNEYDHSMQSYISFQAPSIIQVINHEKNRFYNHLDHQQHQNHLTIGMNHLNTLGGFTQSLVTSDHTPSATASSSSFSDLDMNEFIKHGDWDELRSVVQFAASDGRMFFM